MTILLSRLLPPILLLLHAGLLAWALVGLAEWFAPSVPWPPVANPLFPPWVLMLHWLAVLLGSALFLCGYALRWRRTPDLMLIGYGFMAVVCFIETFWFLTHPLRFVAMALEYTAYVAILIAVRVVPTLVARFRAAAAVPGA